MDKSYQGALELVRTNIPKKKLENGFFRAEDVEGSSNIMSDRMIVRTVSSVYALFRV